MCEKTLHVNSVNFTAGPLLSCIEQDAQEVWVSKPYTVRAHREAKL
jgi:hypothetical protein